MENNLNDFTTTEYATEGTAKGWPLDTKVQSLLESVYRPISTTEDLSPEKQARALSKINEILRICDEYEDDPRASEAITSIVTSSLDGLDEKFTFIELMVVLGVIATLIALLLPALDQLR